MKCLHPSAPCRPPARLVWDCPPLQPWNLHISARGELGPERPDTEPVGSVGWWGRLLGPEPGQPRAGRPDAGKGTSWGSPRPLLSPLGQSARKAFPDGPEHGKGPRTPPSFQGFPASRLAPRSWEAWGGGGGSEAEGRLRPAAALYPDRGPKRRRGLPVHPRRTPKARRQQDAARGRLSLCAPLPRSLAPSYCSPLLPA